MRGCRATLAFAPLLAVVLVLLLPGQAHPQETNWSFSASAGYAILNMGEVRRDNERDVQGWRQQGADLTDFPPLNPVTFVAARASYRWGPFGAVSLSVTDFSRVMEITSTSSVPFLKLSRSIGATDFMLGARNMFPIVLEPLELYVELQAGYTLAWAGAQAFGTTIILVGKDSTAVTFVDSQTRYALRRPFAAVGFGASLPVAGPLALKAEGLYKGGPIGRMDGETTANGETVSIASAVDFDYSGLFLSLGLALQF